MLQTASAKRFLMLLLFVGSYACSYNNADSANIEAPEPALITSQYISEASGIAASHRNDSLLWLINDSGNAPKLHAVDNRGQELASYTIKGTNNHDWEDLASFKYRGFPYILIADVGDNHAKRDTYQLHVVPEPDIAAAKQSKGVITPAWSFRFRYEDGPRDCESVAVDTVRQKILLLSKRDNPPVLYELPLVPQSTGTLIAQRLGEIPPLPKPSQGYLRLIDILSYNTQPTAMDISADGQSLVVLTYGSAWYFSASQGSSWLNVLATQPTEVTLPPLKQAESAAFDASGKHIYVTSEKLPAPLLKLPLKQAKVGNSVRKQ